MEPLRPPEDYIPPDVQAAVDRYKEAVHAQDPMVRQSLGDPLELLNEAVAVAERTKIANAILPQNPNQSMSWPEILIMNTAFLSQNPNSNRKFSGG